MSDKLNDLLLAALQRAGKPRTSGELLDDATGLALAEGWEPSQTAKLTAKSVAKRLQHMAGVHAVGEKLVPGSGRMTATFVPVDGYEPAAPVPAPPAIERALAATPTGYDGLNRAQLLAVLDVHDSFAECISRFMADLGRQRERARQRLMAAGVEMD